jgi:aspartate ammonia-lyase
LEKKYRNVKRVSYTQLQKAVPSTYGHLFGSYNDALSRDWWRVSKCFERIKVVNLGGGAIGTGMGIPSFFSIEVTSKLKSLTGLPVTRSENLHDATSNIDKYCEVHGMLKAHAVNLEKIVSDLRLIGSDMGGNKISLPAAQTGSSIMPGKINPVIPEFVISCAHKVYVNDILITRLAGMGNLDLNAYIPVVGDSMLNSLGLLISANESIHSHLLKEIEISDIKNNEELFYSPSTSTILVPIIGYQKASEIAVYMKENAVSIFQANEKLGFLSADKLDNIINNPANLLSSFRIGDLNL